jgi:uncharacterized protein (TIGR02001 family)
MKTLNQFKKRQMVSMLCAAPLLLGSTFLQAAEMAAAEAPVASPWSFNATLATQYVTRGFNNSLGSPVIQGGVDYVHPSGFNAGFWLSTLSNEFVQGSWAETDYYAGYTKSFGDLSIGAQIYYYIYPNGKFVYNGDKTQAYSKGVSYDYGEIVPTLSYKWFTAKYWYTYTKDYFGANDVSYFTTASTGARNSRGSSYIDLNANIPLDNGFNLIAHYGYQNVKNFEDVNWADGKIGVTKTFENGWSASLLATTVWSKRTENIYGAGYTFDWTKYDINGNGSTSNPVKDSLTLSVTKTF